VGAFRRGADAGQGGPVRRHEAGRVHCQDIRFTQKPDALYAILLAWPAGKVRIGSLPASKRLWFGPIGEVRLVGQAQPLAFSQNDQGLFVDLPPQAPGKHAFVLRIAGTTKP